MMLKDEPLVGDSPLHAIRALREQLAKFRAYAEYPDNQSGILSMSFQCLAAGESREIEQLSAVVTLEPVF